MLEIAQLGHRFGPRVALRDITLTLMPGQILAILGPNGAGKTSLLRLLCGILPLQQGSIRMGALQPGQVEQRSEWRRQVGLLTEAPGLYDLLSVRQNLLLFARLHGLSKFEAQERVESEARNFGLATRIDDPCKQLSKGLRQRVALARSVLHEPKLLLLDEPTSGLDPDSAEELRERLRSWRAQGRMLVLTTHDLSEAHALADQVIVLKQGMVALTESAPERMLSAYRAAIARLDAAAGAP